MLRTRPATGLSLAAVTLVAVLLVACGESQSSEERVSAVSSPETATEENAGSHAVTGQDAREEAEQSGQAAVDAITRGWQQTKDVARQTSETLAEEMDDVDAVVARLWEQTKEQARRMGNALEEMAPAADQALELAWQRTKDAVQDVVRRAGEAWRGDAPPEEDETAAGEVSL